MKPTILVFVRYLAALWALSFVPAGWAAVIIQYHHISEDTPRATSTSPALFAKHLAHLEAHDYSVVPLEELAAKREAGDPLPDRAVAITFDDAYSSVYEEAFPLLKKYDFPFTVFVNAKPIDQGNQQFVSWAQLREMGEAGGTIANHSYSHPHFLRRLDGETDKQWRQRITEEIVRTEKAIEKHTDQAHKLFAYPYGEYDPASQEILADLGFVSFGQQSGPMADYSDLQAIPRFPFGGSYGEMDDFATKVASKPMPIERAQVFSSRGKKLTDILLPQSEAQPKLELRLTDTALHQRVQCFASGQGTIPVTVTDDALYTRAQRDLPVGRSRYNCTAASGEPGRFYWYSQLFIRKKPDGSWYPEP